MRVIDLHCDTLMQLADAPQSGDLGRNPWKIDLEKMEKGQYLIQDFACFVDLENDDEPWQRYKTMVAIFHENMERYHQIIRPIYSYGDIKTIETNGLMGGLLSIEEGGVVGTADRLPEVYDDGVRLITLSWNYANGLAHPQGERYQGEGLTHTGFEFVEAMQSLGMIVDCSHLNDSSTEDVLRIAKKPVIASHSNARTITPHWRNLPDPLIRAIAECGGVIGLNFAHQFLGESKVSRKEDIARHAWHIYQVGGADVLALGSDFDGIDPTTEVQDASDMGSLYSAFKNVGFDDTVIEKLYAENAKRVLREILA